MTVSDAYRRRIPAHLLDLITQPPTRTEQREPVPPPAAPKREPGVEQANNPELVEKLVASTPSRIAVGRTGTRYRTATYLDLREDHAVAKDAVYANLRPELAAQLGCVEVVSRCNDREHYLLHPNHGRRLSDESKAQLEARAERGADVQIIMADGLSAPALELNGPSLLSSLTAALRALGFTTGKPILAHMARVGLQDDIGMVLGCRATAICLGERPGLGTGDSLSIYIAVGPKLDQDNSEKNCISNIRPQGLSTAKAAAMAAELLQRGIAAGRCGLSLTS